MPDPTSWLVAGNSGTDQGQDFLGTTDNTGLTIKTNGTERILVTASGSVGIGTDSPADLVTVNTATNDAGITIQGASGGRPSLPGASPTLKFSDSSGVVHTRIGIAGAEGDLASGSSPNDLVIRTEGNNIALTTNYGAPSALTVATSGNVGIGTSSPADLVTVNTAANDAGITIQGANSTGGVSPTFKFSDHTGAVHTRIGIAGAPGNLASGSSPNDLVIRTEGNNIALTTNYGAPSALTVATSGNVGIGTSSPADLVTVNTAANDAGITVQGANSTGGVSPTLKFSDHTGAVHTRIGIAGAPGNLASGSSQNDLVIRTEGTNIALATNSGGPSALTVATGGNVGIGTQTPLAPLHVVLPTPSPHFPAGSPGVLIECSSTGTGSPKLGLVDTWQSPGNIAPMWGVDNDQDLFRIFRMPNFDTGGIVYLTIDNQGNVSVLNGGNLNVSGDVILQGADCAEHFDVSDEEQPEPGTVMVIDDEGALRKSHEAYDKKVAGVVSGAGEYRPGIVLDKQDSGDSRVAVALVGKVYCKVDAQYSPIDVGDLLTTSPTPGHAMKAAEPGRAFGAIIGKALRSLAVGSGLIPILIALQ